MNLYVYRRTFNYDFEEAYLIKANSEEEALNEIRKEKERYKSSDKFVDSNCLELVDFEGDNVVQI